MSFFPLHFKEERQQEKGRGGKQGNDNSKRVESKKYEQRRFGDFCPSTYLQEGALPGNVRESDSLRLLGRRARCQTM